MLGLISALSLPLGALTSFFWRPTDRTTAILMAFGGGALLAALTIDLVASSVEQGHFYALAIGAIIGGLLFLALNQIINDYGGFLRKASTTFYYLRRKQHQRIRQIAHQINRVKLFHELRTRDFKALAASVSTVEYRKGQWIYQGGDPGEALYIVASGAVELFDPIREMSSVDVLGKFDVFGWKSVLAGAPTGHSAAAKEDVTLWVIPKGAIDTLILGSPEFLQVVHLQLRSREISEYLKNQQGMTVQQVSEWQDIACRSLMKKGDYPEALEVKRNTEGFLADIDRIRRFPLIHGLPPEEEELIASLLVFKRYPRGESFFHQRDLSDRMFFIEAGEVNLVSPQTGYHKPLALHASDTFGGMSFITGSRHSTTAVAAEETIVWELRKRDLDELLRRAPELSHRLHAYINHGEPGDYLKNRHHFDAEKSSRWTKQAMLALDEGTVLPLAVDATLEHQNSHGAPLAIWLGITLDGIPESLVIGASLVNAKISLSLIAGLFLANYPEALSSSVGMQQRGFSHRRIFIMWSSLMVITGIGAGLGSLFFVGAPPNAFVLVEGLAAGAMLTMIAETMLPEAYMKGGSVVGMSTLMGFLVAIFFKTLE